MFSRIRRKINKRMVGAFIVLIGFLALLCMAGADDVAVSQGVHGAILPLLLKGAFCLAMMAIGAKMIGGEEQ